MRSRNPEARVELKRPRTSSAERGGEGTSSACVSCSEVVAACCPAVSGPRHCQGIPSEPGHIGMAVHGIESPGLAAQCLVDQWSRVAYRLQSTILCQRQRPELPSKPLQVRCCGRKSRPRRCRIGGQDRGRLDPGGRKGLLGREPFPRGHPTGSEGSCPAQQTERRDGRTGEDAACRKAGTRRSPKTTEMVVAKAETETEATPRLRRQFAA